MSKTGVMNLGHCALVRKVVSSMEILKGKQSLKLIVFVSRVFSTCSLEEDEMLLTVCLLKRKPKVTNSDIVKSKVNQLNHSMDVGWQNEKNYSVQFSNFRHSRVGIRHFSK